MSPTNWHLPKAFASNQTTTIRAFAICLCCCSCWPLTPRGEFRVKSEALCAPGKPKEQVIRQWDSFGNWFHDPDPCISSYLLLLLLSHFSRVWLCATPETAAHQAPPSLGFSRQEHWSGLPFPSPIQESEKWKVKGKSLSRVRLLATPWTAAYQAPPSMGFSRQEYWSGMPLPSLLLISRKMLNPFMLTSALSGKPFVK